MPSFSDTLATVKHNKKLILNYCIPSAIALKVGLEKHNEVNFFLFSYNSENTL